MSAIPHTLLLIFLCTLNLLIVVNWVFGLERASSYALVACLSLVLTRAIKKQARLPVRHLLVILAIVPTLMSALLIKRYWQYHSYLNAELLQDQSESITTAPHHEQARLNLILITVDTLRRDALGCYGSTNVTPHIDRLASLGTRFEKANSISNHTWPSMTGLFTSMPPSRLSNGEWTYEIPAEFPLLAEQLRHKGYTTAAVVANYGLEINPAGLRRGFDSFSALHHKTAHVRFGDQGLPHPDMTFPWKLFHPPPQPPDTTKFVSDKGSTFLEGINGSYFLWLHFMDPHDPYAPPRRLVEDQSLPIERLSKLDDQFWYDVLIGLHYISRKDKEDVRQAYLAEVRYVDESIGRLMTVLDERKLWKNTIVVLTSDHGEEFWDHQTWEHGHNFHDVLVNVPLVIYRPDLKGGRIFEAPVSHLDLMPSLFNWLGLEPYSGHAGRTLPTQFEEKSYQEKPIFFEEGYTNQNQLAILYGGSKLVYDWVDDEHKIVEEDTYRTYPRPNIDKTREMLTLAREHLNRNRRENSEGEVLIGEKFKDMLKSLGYLREK